MRGGRAHGPPHFVPLLRSGRSGGGDVPLLGKTFAAEHRPALRGAEGHGSLLATLGAGSTGLHAGVVVSVARNWGSGEDSHALGLAGLTALGLVLELLVVKEELFARGEHELGAAVDTGQYLVLKFH